MNENYVSAILLLGTIPLINILIVGRSIFTRSAAVVALLLIAASALILASRGMLIAAAVSIAVVAKGMGFRHNARLRTVLVLSSIVVLILVMAVITTEDAGFAARFGSADVTTFNGRTTIWAYSLKYFINGGLLSMFFGNGLSSTPFFLTPALPEFANLHNTYLLWLMEQGLIGLVVFGAVIYAVQRLITRSTHKMKHMLLGWLTFCLVAGLSATISDEHVFWIMLGILIGASAASPDSPDEIVTAEAVAGKNRVASLRVA